MAAPKLCRDCGVRPKWRTKQRCAWCYLETLPIMQQIATADRRLAKAEAQPGYVRRGRVPASEWPPNCRWCSGCQSMVALSYCRDSDSRCRACASRAAHGSRIAKLYDMSPQDYAALFAWQGGKCYVCGKRTTKRLAVDHDHRTGEQRGLLCANDEWGCNMSLRIVLNDLPTARRLFRYVQKPPVARWRDGEAPPTYEDDGA